MKISAPPKEYTDDIRYYRGLNIAVNNTQIDIHETPDMLNCLPDDRKALDNRPGLKNIFTSIGAGQINLFDRYRKDTGTLELFSHSDKLYKIDDLDLGTYTQIGAGLNDNRVRGLTYQNEYYFLDGSAYRKTDGSTVSSVTGYIPTVLIGTTPAGAGTPFEQLNLIQPGFTVQYSGDGSSTLYQLPYTNLDATTVTATVDGVAKVEGVDFTVNRTTGQVTFTVAPPATAVNNVIITAYKDFGTASDILDCTIIYSWGGSDGTRVWVTGNPNKINTDWSSGLLDPTYFPANGFDNVGNDDNPIMGYSRMYQRLIIIKRRSVYMRIYDDINQLFYTQRLNGYIGALSTDSIQLLDSFPTFVSRSGVYQVTSIDPENENNVKLISNAINRNANPLSIEGILELNGLDTYTSIDFDNKYWLFNPSEGIVWVYDYDYVVNGLGQWFRLGNIFCSVPLEIDSVLYIGHANKGMISKTSADNVDDIEDETNTIIYTYWTSLIYNFGSITNLKLVKAIFWSIKPSPSTRVDLYVRSNLKSNWKFIKTLRKLYFSYSTLTYSKFSYGGNLFPQQARSKVKNKKIGFYQIKFENNEQGSRFSLIDTALKFLLQREVKR